MITDKSMIKYFLLSFISILAGSCDWIEGPQLYDPVESIFSWNGFYIVNEGNFRAGNGSLSFYSYDSTKIHNDIFLKINGSGDTLFYIDRGIRRMSISDTQLPAEPLVPEDTRLFYKIGINPVSSEIIATDAVDYQQNGYIIRYSPNGLRISSLQAGIIPGSVCFKVRLNPVIV